MVEPLPFEPIAGLPGWSAAHLTSTGSTMTDLARLVAEGRAGEGRLWLTAAAQTAGRGRRGRPWTSPPGNLYASLVLVDPAPPGSLGTLPLVCGLAMRAAVAEELGEGAPPVTLKWPNDVLIDGGKCCGILLEQVPVPGGGMAVVFGCGINITSHPLETPYPATHLKAHQPNASAQTLFHRIAEAHAHCLARFDHGRGAPAIVADVRRHVHGVGQSMTVRLESNQSQGVFEGIADDGRLILRLADGTHKRFAAGDVFF